MSIPTRPVRDPSNTKTLVAPEWLSKESQAVFNELAQSLSHMKITQDSDIHSLAVLADALMDYRIAVQLIDDEGHLVLGRDGSQVKNPAYTMKNMSWQRVQPLLASFALTPSARASMKIGSDTKEVSLLDNILAGIPVAPESPSKTH